MHHHRQAYGALYYSETMQTFLFTDIESSTRLWEDQPTEMAAALARHDAILTETISRTWGTVLKTTGDGLIAVFDSVGDAVAATLLAQKALGAEPWRTTGPLRVRMAMTCWPKRKAVMGTTSDRR